jgi:hypothetical protein
MPWKGKTGLVRRNGSDARARRSVCCTSGCARIVARVIPCVVYSAKSTEDVRARLGRRRRTVATRSVPREVGRSSRVLRRGSRQLAEGGELLATQPIEVYSSLFESGIAL